MRGRKPTPNELKELSGNPGKRPLEDCPNPNKSIPPCPAQFRGEAKREWKRISIALYELGLLSDIDHAALEAYCVEYDRWCEAERKVRELGPMVAPPPKRSADGLFSDSTAKSGCATEPHVSQLLWNPYLAIAAKSMERMLKLLAEFGMTPVSRVRLRSGKPEEQDKAEAFLFGNDAGETPALHQRNDGDHVQ